MFKALTERIKNEVVNDLSTDMYRIKQHEKRLTALELDLGLLLDYLHAEIKTARPQVVHRDDRESKGGDSTCKEN